jgi:hypothetical protein
VDGVPDEDGYIEWMYELAVSGGTKNTTSTRLRHVHPSSDVSAPAEVHPVKDVDDVPRTISMELRNDVLMEKCMSVLQGIELFKAAMGGPDASILCVLTEEVESTRIAETDKKGCLDILRTARRAYSELASSQS